MLLDDLKKTDVMSIAGYGFTDRTDNAQLCIYVCFLDAKLLSLLPLEGHTAGEIMFEKI